jgi:preprotein translocase subunit SecG
MTTPAPAPSMGPAPVADGKTLGIVGLVLAFVFPLAGLIVSIIAKNQSKAAGVENTPAKIGLILSIVFLILGIIIGIIYGIAAAALIGSGAVYTTY